MDARSSDLHTERFGSRSDAPVLDREVFGLTELHLGDSDVVEKEDDRVPFAKKRGPPPEAVESGRVHFARYGLRDSQIPGRHIIGANRMLGKYVRVAKVNDFGGRPVDPGRDERKRPTERLEVVVSQPRTTVTADALGDGMLRVLGQV